MSLRYRIKKRNKASMILSDLMPLNTVKDTFGGVPPVPRKPNYDSLEEKKWDIRHLTYGAILLLERNNHISRHQTQDHNGKLTFHGWMATEAGREAYLESYYDKENDKDRLETNKLKYDRFIPILSISFSALALMVSIITLIHTWNKK